MRIDPSPSDLTNRGPSAPPGRLRSLRQKLRASRRRTVVAVATAAVATGFALRPQPAPEPIDLGAGRAGVRSEAVVSTPTPVAEQATPLESSQTETVETAAPVGEPLGSGEASYYADELAGQPTASGEPHEPTELTAAHRTLPLGTRIRVTNVRNNESVIVRVNDRGPFAKHRVVDLSKAAARELKMLRRGTARVRMEVLPARG